MNPQGITEFANGKQRFGYFIDTIFPGREPVRGVEIGVHLGVHSEIMLKNKPTLHLHGVDLWEKHVQQDTGYLSSPGTLPRRFAETAYGLECHQAAETRLRKFGNRVSLLCASSKEAAATFADASFDFVYIDGDHGYDGCRLDIRLWLHKVKPGGVLAGHDWTWEGVARAVSEAFPRGVVHNQADEKTGQCWLVVLP